MQNELFSSANHVDGNGAMVAAFPFRFYVCTRKDAYLSPYARAFIELIRTLGKKERINPTNEK